MPRVWSYHRLKSAAQKEAKRARRKGEKVKVLRHKKGYKVAVVTKYD